MPSCIERVRSDRRLDKFYPKIVYVLSGGAATGFCHLGMIEALEKRGITPDLVVGTSAGSLFGALYCHFGNVQGVFEKAEAVFASDEFKEFEKRYFREKKRADGRVQSGMRHFFSSLAGTLKNGMQLGKALVTSAMVSEKDAFSIFSRIFDGLTFQGLKVPFAAVEIAGHVHADGNIMANLPVREARTLLAGQEGLLVGFDVSAPVKSIEEDFSTVELVLRLLDLSMRSKQSADRELIDVLFQPMERSYPWSSFAEYKTLFELGRR